MYVAQKPIRITVQEGGKPTVRVIPAGCPIPDDEIGKWSHAQIIAHLNLDWIKWRGEVEDTPHLMHRKKIVDMRAYRGEVPPKGAPDPVVAAGSGANSQSLNCEFCADRRGFKNRAALVSHVRSKHPDADQRVG